MSWFYLPEGEGASTEVCCSDTLPYAPWKSTPTPAESCLSDSATARSPGFQCGMTCEPSTADRGADTSMSSAAGSLARTSASPGREMDLTESAAACGTRWRGLLAKFAPDTSSWRTVQPSLHADLIESSLDLPRWGSMRNGELWERATPELFTGETESGYWPTATARDWRDTSPSPSHLRRHTMTLGQIVLWPTPQAHDATPGHAKRVGRFGTKAGGRNLNDEVAMWPTPTKADGMGGPGRGKNRQGGDNLRTAVSGRLNPEWVEWLMGWPIGSTALSPLGTGRFREWLRWHGNYSNDSGADAPKEKRDE